MGGSPTNDTMMHGVTEKAATSSLFSERVKNKLGNFFPFTMGTGTGDEPHTNEEDKSMRAIDDSGSQVSLRQTKIPQTRIMAARNDLLRSEPETKLLKEYKIERVHDNSKFGQAIRIV